MSPLYRQVEANRQTLRGLTQTAESDRSHINSAMCLEPVKKPKRGKNRPSTYPREEGRMGKIAENSASSLYNCINATGIAFIQLKRSLSLYV